MAKRSDYSLSVFINCPFDTDYAPLLRAIVFAVHDCGCTARSALEVADSSEVRIEKIARIIERCRFGLHDLSRTELDLKSKLPRFNMPLELGLFLGAKRFGRPPHGNKALLVLDRVPYRYQRFCSDISGQDVAAHGNKAEAAIKRVRDWLSSHLSGARIPSGTIMAARYRDFLSGFPLLCDALRLDVDPPFPDLAVVVSRWLRKNPVVSWRTH